jgi:hypothetical protein
MPMPKGLFDFERHRADVMNFSFSSSDYKKAVGGETVRVHQVKRKITFVANECVLNKLILCVQFVWSSQHKVMTENALTKGH